MEELRKRLASVLFAYIQIPAFRKSEHRGFISVNLDWIIRDNELNLDHELNEEVEDVQEIVDEVLEKLTDQIQEYWIQLYMGKGYYQDRSEFIVHEHQNQVNSLHNGKKVTFRIDKIDGKLLLAGIEDKINPNNDYGFEFPYFICSE